MKSQNLSLWWLNYHCLFAFKITVSAWSNYAGRSNFRISTKLLPIHEWSYLATIPLSMMTISWESSLNHLRRFCGPPNFMGVWDTILLYQNIHISSNLAHFWYKRAFIQFCKTVYVWGMLTKSFLLVDCLDRYEKNRLVEVKLGLPVNRDWLIKNETGPKFDY